MSENTLKIAALQTARGGSKSIPKKNLLEVNMHPLFAHSIMAATECDKINSVWCSTDDEQIKSLADFYEFKIINRPAELATDDCSHLDAIRHGILEIEKHEGKLDVVVLLLGNVSGVDSDALSEAIDMLTEEWDSVVSVSKFNMFNPFRAMRIDDGELNTWIPQDSIVTDTQANDKNSAGDIFYCNGNFWIMKRDVVFQDGNKLPFQWLGHRIRPYVQDVFLELDAPWQQEYVMRSIKNKKTM